MQKTETDFLLPPSPQISIVVPVYRNREALPELHSRLENVLKKLPLSYEIVLVDDACPEGSADVLAVLALLDPHVVVLLLERNVGQQRAVLTGLRYAVGNWVVVMDGDLQDPPEAILELLDSIGRTGAGAVFAGRRGSYESGMRLITSRLFKYLLHLLCGVPKDAGIFLIMKRSVVDRVLEFRVRYPFLVAMVGCSGSPLVSVPVARSRRPMGGSAYSSLARLKTGLRAIMLALSLKYGSPDHGADDVRIKAFLGARFSSKTGCEL